MRYDRIARQGALQHPFFIPVFRELQDQVEQHGDHAENHDGSDDHRHFKGLTSVDDKVAKPPSCGEEFSDDNAD